MLQVLFIVLFAVGLMLSIALHELGHLIPAKRFGVKVSEYFVGFGSTLFSRQRGETTYGIKAFPLGGYVRLVGMVPPGDAVKPVKVRGWMRDLIDDARTASEAEIGADRDRAFYRLSWWKKAIVMAGGPVVNLVLAALLFTVVFSGIGSHVQTLTVRDTVACVPPAGTVDCAPGDEESPAVTAGIQPGDVFVAVDGIPTESWADVADYVSQRPGEPVELTMSRGGETVELSLTPAPRQVVAGDGSAAVDTVGYMGVYSQTQRERQPLTSGIEVTGDYIAQTAVVITQLPQQLWHISRAALRLEERSQESVMGLVGVGRVAGDVGANDNEGVTNLDKVAQLLLLLGGLNLALFVFNMIPLVPLDGGHIASAFWQAIKNAWARSRHLAHPAPVDVARMMPLAYSVFGVLIVMSLVLVFADIVAPVRLT
ncbi:site-2 protease family protein [Demequina sp. TTPB684]|uniref:M50 family metallopeptidase n=1 Tax=unclassified Demequina TaxID=2620311 RepID=UPI001CF43671|nr:MULTISPECIES: site-2 protease family protein [unclassified Demequina]MCB2412166.1 site-2 protease family protein [Demequina sp. TTPB684]UPU89642.1 site-2 protease family protein [Demequina sp. TMPB413]